MTLEATYPAHLEYLQRGTEDALAAHGFDAVVLCSGSPAARNRFDDQSWPVMPTPAYAHWCPLVEADAFVVVRPGARPRLVRTIVDDFWEVTPPPESSHFWPCFELVEVSPGHAGDALPGGNVAVITRDAGSSPPGTVNPPALLAALDALRTRKTAYEIECLAEASRRAARGHLRAGELFQTQAAVGARPPPRLPRRVRAGRSVGARTRASSRSATTPRCCTSSRTPATASPATPRCWSTPARGASATAATSRAPTCAATARRRAGSPSCSRHMEALQQEIIRRIRPGLPYEDLHDDSHRLLAVVLRELGIGRGSPEELVARGVTRALYPHGLGHSLGVTVHDVGMKPRPPRADNKFLRNTSVIEPGQVFTIEPGIYVIDALLAPLQADDRRELVDWAAIAELRPFGGIRIEDNVVVEPRGVRNLTREAFAQA